MYIIFVVKTFNCFTRDFVNISCIHLHLSFLFIALFYFVKKKISMLPTETIQWVYHVLLILNIIHTHAHTYTYMRVGACAGARVCTYVSIWQQCK